MKRYYPAFDSVSKIVRCLLSVIVIWTFGIMFSGCSNHFDELGIPDCGIKESATNSSFNVSKEDAINIAKKVLNKPITRSFVADFPIFEYVINEKQTRSASSADTLAYVLNYPSNAGFVIVSTDRRVYPVLAFSNQGNFSFENENAKTNFIDNLSTYLEGLDSETIYEVSENDFDGCYVIQPMVQISLSQGSPWDKYVIVEHPNCPVGCVAVATALVMSHSKYQINYHNSIYHLKSMITAINNGQNSTKTNAPQRIVGGYPPVQPTYTYEQAVDSMAKLLYWIGKDVNMSYSPGGSGAVSRDAYELCKSLNFSIPSGFATFDIKEVTQYLKDNHIVYLRGSDINGKGGHAWVSDACYFCVDYSDRSQILDTYIHCDWGWGGSCNGYYSGSVFEASSYKFRPGNYFAIKREWK